MNYEKIQESLKNNNLIVKFKHFRMPEDINGAFNDIKLDIKNITAAASQKHFFEKDGRGCRKISSNGGFTLAEVFDSDNNKVAFAKSYCSLKDCYNKKNGRVKSLGRAYAQLLKKGLING